MAVMILIGAAGALAAFWTWIWLTSTCQRELLDYQSGRYPSSSVTIRYRWRTRTSDWRETTVRGPIMWHSAETGELLDTLGRTYTWLNNTHRIQRWKHEDNR